MSVLPLNWPDKVDSPELLAWLQQFGLEKYIDSNQINSIRDAINELYLSSNPNRIISTGTEIKDGNQYTYVDYQWMINGQVFDNYNRPLSLLINPTTPGYKRNDIGILTNTGDVMQVQGEETNGEVVTSPDVPPGSILLKIYNVVGNQITIDPTPIIVGNQFVEKTDFNPYNSNVTGTDAIIPLDPNGYSEIRLTNTGLISIAGYDLSLISGNANAKSPYPGKPFIIRNLTGNDVVIKKELPAADYPFYFSEESDLVFPNNHYIYASFDPSGFRVIFKSWVDLSIKLDKVTTEGVERVYTINPDGSQETKPTSDLGGKQSYFVDWEGYIQFIQNPTGWFSRNVGPQNIYWTSQFGYLIGTNPQDFDTRQICKVLPFDCKLINANIRINQRNATRTIRIKGYKFNSILSQLTPINVVEIFDLTKNLTNVGVSLVQGVDFTINSTNLSKGDLFLFVVNQVDDLSGVALNLSMNFEFEKI